jgi:biotin carboxylase
MLVLICGDHRIYFDINGQCVLADLPFPVLVLASRASEAALAPLLPNVPIHRATWSDFGQIRARVLALRQSDPIFKVITMNESLMDLAAQLREALGVDGMTRALTTRFRHKLRMKEALREHAIAIPEFSPCCERAHVESLFARHRKLVIKPVDGLGSRWVTVVASAQQLDAWYASASASDVAGFEAEQFIDGAMYHANALVSAGKILLTACAAYVPGRSSINYMDGQPLVSVMLDDPAQRAQLTAMSDRVIAALGLASGVTHLECFLTPAGQWVVCEIAARPAGGGIVPLMEAHCGVNFVRAALLLEAGLGELIDLGHAQLAGVHGLVGVRARRNATIAGLAGAQQFQDPWVRYLAVYVQVGQFIRAARQSADFLALLVLAARDRDDFDDKAASAYQRFMDQLQLVDEHAAAAPRARRRGSDDEG